MARRLTGNFGETDRLNELNGIDEERISNENRFRGSDHRNARGSADAAPAPGENEDEEAVEEANRLPYGLAAYAYTNSTKTAEAISNELESGMVSINHHGLGLPETPFGGVQDSGYGKEGGSEGIEAYLSTKFVSQSNS